MTSQSATVLTQQPAAVDVVFFFLSALCWDCFRSAPGGGIAEEGEGGSRVGGMEPNRRPHRDAHPPMSAVRGAVVSGRRKPM